jgi:hypothetical protein
MLGCRVRQVNRPVLRNRGSFAAVPKSGESGTNDSALVATNDRSLSELPRDEMRRLRAGIVVGAVSIGSFEVSR